MANRHPYEDEPGRWQGRRSSERGQWQDEGEVGEHDRPWRHSRESSEAGVRRGGGYGLGGAERGYNMGGYGGYEEGYRRGSYDRLLDLSEQRYYGQADADSDESREADERHGYEENRDRWSHQTYGGREPDEDERYGARAVGFGRETWSDEWQAPERSHSGWNLREGLHRLGRSAREAFRGGTLEWTARSRGVGKAPKGYQRSDERIRENICELLMNSPYDASNVDITVNQGEVTLTGTVRRRAEKWGIEDMAEAVLGVTDVHNQIRVDRSEAQPSDLSSETDTRGLHS
jgi:hypothetical protein